MAESFKVEFHIYQRTKSRKNLTWQTISMERSWSGWNSTAPFSCKRCVDTKKRQVDSKPIFCKSEFHVLGLKITVDSLRNGG